MVTVRLATKADLLPAAQVKAQAWLETYDQVFPGDFLQFITSDNEVPKHAAWWAQLMDSGVQFWVAVADDFHEDVKEASNLEEADFEAGTIDRANGVRSGNERIVGVVNAMDSRDEDAPTELELTMIYVLRQYQGSGVGQKLFEAAVGTKPCSLWVLKDNKQAIGFYESLGFVTDGVEKSFLGEEASVPLEIRMVRH